MTVRLARAAEEDIARIHTYIAESDPVQANGVTRAVLGAIESLATFPLIGREGKVGGTRERVMARYPYKIVYRVVNEQIFILRVLHHRQNWP